ncbi:MAG: hypothetical protein II362_02500 [Alistipes sp.]|nr:hypothetical protein [Alistipes sp.]MBQ1939068.1 hypothetical protein [Alistipes sp.]MBQ2392696.1 hypothetical protein [Alistipes sp.]MBQ5394999.1 hypothetical protein [Alistipes sp.]MBQ5639016.1 hypothetical protein [Alistipes sp.]
MAMWYAVKCGGCGKEFNYVAGELMMCVGCGVESDYEAPFFCPECNRRIDPRREEGQAQILERALID